MTQRVSWLLPVLAACAAGGETEPAASASAPAAFAEGRVEFGTVAWRRDFPAALEEARRERRDALLVFQEVPG